MIPELTSRKELTVGNQVQYPAGDQGGAMSCATAMFAAAATSVPFGVCVVADSGGIIFAAYLNHTGADTAAIVTTIRAEVKK
ncbi:MAG TPA: hypothetical protein VGJ28_03105 [Micromonosporaceae bacterium]|jgi:sugar/nucleoside kinase (ribokinase family)